MIQNFTPNDTLKFQKTPKTDSSLDFNEKKTLELIKNSLESDLMVPKQSTIDKILEYAKK